MTTYTRYFDYDASGANDGTSETDAWSDTATMRTALSTLFGTTASDGDTVHVYFKDSATSAAATTGWDTLDSVTIPAAGKLINAIYEGYKTTPGDGGDDGYNNYFRLAAQVDVGYCTIRYFKIVRSANVADGSLNLRNRALGHDCYVDIEDTVGTRAAVRVNKSSLVNCYVSLKNQGTSGDQHAIRMEVNSSVVGCVIRGGVKMYTRYSSSRLINSLVLPWPSGSASLAAGMLIEVEGSIDWRGLDITGNTIYDAPGDGISFLDSVTRETELNGVQISDNIIYSCGAYAFDNDQNTHATTMILKGVNNFYGSCTSGLASGTVNADAIEATLLTSDPFVDAAGEDFRVDRNSAGGQQILAARLATMPENVLGVPSQTIAGAYQRTGRGAVAY
jgi:hypothetical protein